LADMVSLEVAVGNQHPFIDPSEMCISETSDAEIILFNTYLDHSSNHPEY